MRAKRNTHHFECDYCIVGAGSAGSVVADRLSEDGRFRVLLLEAGPVDKNPLIYVPAGFLKLQNNKAINWRFRSEQCPELNDRRLDLSQGKVLGGSSSINGTLFVRGYPEEYDRWAELGCTGWSYAELLPHFRSIEHYDGGHSADRGSDGPLPVTALAVQHPLSWAFIESARSLGFPMLSDINGPRDIGVGWFQQNRQGRFRASTSSTFLKRARARPNFQLITNALCTRVLFEGRGAIGVEFLRDGHLFNVKARQEVILAAGALKSPQILQLSGVGASNLLSRYGIPLVHHAAGVGENLKDHFLVRVAHRVRGCVTLNERARGWRLLRESLAYALLGGGLMSIGASNAVLFARSRDGVVAADLQLSFTPGSYAGLGKLESVPGMTVGLWQSFPESSGRVSIVSADPNVPPAISLGYLTAHLDSSVLLAGIRLARGLFKTPKLARFSACETLPGPSITSDAELLGHARAYGASALHFSSTCRMGINESAVVDPELQVYGVRGLRVVDASVMPIASSVNTHAVTMAIAEKASSIIRSSIK
ncbi:choline dehydrogenase [Mesorhizobium sp. M5C.F.Cr.IN.023.01.1.1]|uniref:GMC family oxidoreductase n=1 Tax=Mesorhizobium sp. M5C.F.Cr.IN.023.01.1.1 TaxID=2496768 RepID=UPI000FCB3699|nr:GMC family oxidoreductase N-terminal domain-containing protein [Mesorhizobium sp. M5C.F.Cr.IN.023.01.1.1]RUV77474.1 choline dehydrogenase [Mesorhizobium sp. M5C.F.Cr.IN.023.01.1.1]